MIQYARRLLLFQNPRPVEWVLYFGVFAVLHIPGIINFYDNDGVNNAYLRFSESLLQGHFTMPEMPAYDDMILYQGQHYLPYPPFPSILLAPFVALFGYQAVNTVVVALILTCLNFFLFHRILTRLNVEQKYFPWLIAAFFFGTGYWFALFTSHAVYSFAHITSVTCQFLLINELLGKKRWWLAGIYIGCSFLTRQFTFLYIFLALGYFFYQYKQDKEPVKWSQLIAMLATAGFFVLLYFGYNYSRFGNPLDPGYAYILFNGVLRDRVNEYGVFSARYVLFNLYSFFIKGFNIEFEGNGLMRIKDMDLWGTSLLAASPFFIASVKARLPKLVSIGAWLTILAILTGTMFYHNNGYHQINAMRFSLDFLPLLFMLTVIGIKALPEWLFKGMVVYAVLLNVLGFCIHFLYE